MNYGKPKHKGLVAAGWVFACLGALALLLMNWVAFSKGGLLPGFLPWQLIPVTDDTMGAALPQGSLALVEESYLPTAPQVAAYGDEFGATAFARVINQTGEDYQLGADEGQSLVLAQKSQLQGRVNFYIAGIGSAALWLRQFRLTVAALGTLYLLALLAVLLTRGPRQRARYRRELIELFAFYGEKYDAEESDIDY